MRYASKRVESVLAGIVGGQRHSMNGAVRRLSRQLARNRERLRCQHYCEGEFSYVASYTELARGIVCGYVSLVIL